MFWHFKTANTICCKKNLYSIVVKKKCTQNVKCSRFECPYCKIVMKSVHTKKRQGTSEMFLVYHKSVA